MAKFAKVPDLSLGQQLGVMKRLHPQFSGVWHANQITWRGTLRPAGLSDTYTVEIAYRQGDRPIVRVVSPELVKREGCERLPHVYPGNRPCLYHPKLNEWTAAEAIAKTIVPWAAEWLLHYEFWLATGEWQGGGEEVPIKSGRKGAPLGVLVTLQGKEG